MANPGRIKPTNGYLNKDENNCFIIEDNGNIKCFTEDGVSFQIKYADIDFNNENIICEVNGHKVIINLKKSIDSECIKSIDHFSWTEENTKLFLDLYKTKRKLVLERKLKSYKVLWKIIAADMNTHNYNVTPLQVENKFKTLERAYKNIVNNNRKTGRGRMTCSFEAEMTEIFQNKHNIFPTAISGRNGLFLQPKSKENSSTETMGLGQLENEEEDVDIRLLNEIPSSSNNSNQPETAKKNPRKRKTVEYLNRFQNTIDQYIEESKNDKKPIIEIQQNILQDIMYSFDLRFY
ncbi:uncharacterized protein [Prorops nasuta]|uniref:uncharacterized protein n=1 Tax=Prorops nasuta TaxID=863751 RepID=UPI0034CF459A